LTWCVFFQIGWLATVSAVLEPSPTQSLDVGGPALLRRQEPRGEETQRWEIKDAGSIVASPKLETNSLSGQWRIRLKAGTSTRDPISLLDLDTAHPVRALLEQHQYSLKNFDLEGRINSGDDVEATLKQGESATDERIFSVACDVGWTVVGGGCLGRHANDQVEGSRDLTVNSFKCESISDSADYTKKVFAICAESCATLLDNYTGRHDRFASHDACPGSDVIDPHHICSHEDCSLTECCKTPPICSSFGGTCSGAFAIPRAADTLCSSWTCSAEDCCEPSETCLEWSGGSSDYCQGQGTCLISVGDFATKVCHGTTAAAGLCSTAECCRSGVTCATFDGAGAGCVHSSSTPQQPGATCCGLQCECSDCYR